jgi:hypothetical protein
MEKRWVTWIGILAMIWLIIGVFMPAGSLMQKIVFVTGAPTLYWVAMASRQHIFMALQLVVTLGAVLAFVPEIPDVFRYLIMLSATGMSVVWLDSHRGFRFWGVDSVLAVLGLMLIAIGLATPVSYPALFFSSLGLGGILVAIATEMSILKGIGSRMGLIWVILNLVFAWNPCLQIFHMIVR